MKICVQSEADSGRPGIILNKSIFAVSRQYEDKVVLVGDTSGKRAATRQEDDVGIILGAYSLIETPPL